ncbi:MAG: branched chain amino acid aminotransferase [Nitrospinae bacterium RIFCSPLOWO2_12_FULL_45_22]|nr:MAG: branched chain amino acid aminotransferase [Nitrospinae bacterium RIFCSPLOWO2_12_FULL_45_22]
MEPTKKIWMEGKLVDWNEAKIHILTHTLHYGLGAFEGIRCYKTSRGSAIFRLKEHIDRFFNSIKIIHLKIDYSPEEIIQAITRTIKANELEECYIRPITYIGYGGMGINHRGIPICTAIAVWPWGVYLGDGALTNGIRVKISSYTGHHINVNMTKAKVCGNYANSQLAKIEAIEHGYDEAVMLDPDGYVAQGSGENIFILRKGVIKTPPLTSILEGITRDSVITLAHDLGIPLKEELFPRDELYIADEAFFCGTAAEVTPIKEVDNRVLGNGKPGEVTRRLQQAFFNVVQGKDEKYLDWLYFI